jgi:hypothetical protein
MSKKNYQSLMQLLGGEDHRRIEVKGYMPLAVEKLAPDVYSLCHSGEQNGDYMRDPEIVFLVTDGRAKPTYFRNDYLHIEHCTVPGVFGDVPVRPHLQRDLGSFASMWFRNLRDQGFFEQAKKLSQEEKRQEPDQEISR